VPDCFISYSKSDDELARVVHKSLVEKGLEVFLAPLSVDPGDDWTEKVRTNLKNSTWVVFLASKIACTSPYVQQEVGAAIFSNKKLVPIVWDMDPSDLPGWSNRSQAIDLRGKNQDEIANRIKELARKMKSPDMIGALIVGTILLALVILAVREK